ncbi:hypothetical protein [Fictibacillus gelatini]|uniref:hypothetical protein n=1 Tax=Fictibacillus gelatini TaxID=225985 RepID=UPI0003F4FCF5|nr:hypothetical protein [Fictibacillus gelatini]
MKIYLSMNGERVQGWSSTRGNPDDIEIEVDENHEVLFNPFIFKYDTGELIKDEAYQQELINRKKAHKPIEQQLGEQIANERLERLEAKALQDSLGKEMVDLKLQLLKGGTA